MPDLCFFADENIHRKTIETIRLSGFHVETTFDAGLVGSEDKVILNFCQSHNMILLTADKDFGGLLEFGYLFGKGKVVLLRYKLINVERINHDLLSLFKKENVFLSQIGDGFLIVLSEGRYRIHKFNS